MFADNANNINCKRKMQMVHIDGPVISNIYTLQLDEHKLQDIEV